MRRQRAGLHQSALAPAATQASSFCRSSVVISVMFPGGMASVATCWRIACAQRRIWPGSSKRTPLGALAMPSCVGRAAWQDAHDQVARLQAAADPLGGLGGAGGLGDLFGGA